MPISHRARAIDKVLAFKRVLLATAATVLLASFAMVALPMSANATPAPPGGWTHHHRPHFIHPSEFTGNSAFFPLRTVPVASTKGANSLSVNAKSGTVTGARALPSKVVPALTPASTTFVVNSTTDSSLADDTGVTCVDSADGQCSLRAAVEAADNLGALATPQAAIITLPAGTYTLTGEQGGEIYFENPAGVTVNGAGASTTTVASDGSDRVIGIGGEEEGIGTPVALNGVTVSGGASSSDEIPEAKAPFTLPKPKVESDNEGCGGGIMQEDANDLLELTGVVVSGNAATEAGGGVCADGTLYASSTTITGNTVSDPETNEDGDQIGGGLVTGWDDFSAAVLNNVTVTNNTVDTGSQIGDEEDGWFGAGGGIGFIYGSVASVTNSVISGNTVTSSSASCLGEDTEDDFCGFEAAGGLFTQEANVSVTGTTIANNTVTQTAPCADDCDFGALGGGVLNLGGLSLSSDTITGNVASTGPTGNDTMNAAEGGGIASYAPLNVDSSTIDGNQVVGSENADNDCSISGGAGIFSASPGLNVSNTTIDSNTAVDGAGAGVVSWDPDSYSEISPAPDESPFAPLTLNQLTNDQVTNNKSQSSWTFADNPDPWDFGADGGVYLEDGQAQITGSTIDGNTADGYGGGLWVTDWSLASLRNSTVANNSAAVAGGVIETYDSNLLTSNATIANNTATAATDCNDCEDLPLGGGGVYGLDGSIFAFNFSTIAGNTAPAAGAGVSFVGGSGIGTSAGTIIANNTDSTTSGESDCSNAPSEDPIGLTSGGWNLSGDASCGFSQPTDLVSVNPELGPLANNGGPAPTMLPAKSSPAVDAGGNSAACPTTDERGTTRPQGTACDIGAVELFVPPAGYWVVGSDGGVFAFGGAGFFGSAGGPGLNAPAVGIAATPDEKGYWVASSNGGVVAFGDAGNFGNLQGTVLNAPVVGIAATPDGQGYWLAGADGGIFAFGDAAFYGSTGGLTLNEPIVGIAATPDGGGYWEVASDGGIFSFGDAQFYGSTGSLILNQPVVGMAPTPDGGGYWLVAADGGIFSFGDAAFYGSTGSLTLNQPIVGMAVTHGGNGYYMVAADGGIFSFGDAAYEGSLPGLGINVSDISGIAST